MKLKVATLLGVGLLALTACGPKAVDYDTFRLKAQEAYEKSKEVTFETVTYKATDGSDVTTELVVKFSKGAYVVRDDTPVKDVVAATVLVALLDVGMAVNIGNDENIKYYVGGFKIVDDDTTTTFNEYGLVTSSKTNDSQFTVSYKK